MKDFYMEDKPGYILYNIPLRGSDTAELWNNLPMAGGLKQLVEKHGIAATWLPRYDVLDDQGYLELLQSLDSKQEIGLWFEISLSLAKKAGVPYLIDSQEHWYWAEHCLSMGYSQDERILLVDAAIEKFYQVFRFYPRTVSMWMIDTFSAKYLQERYGVKSIGLCRNQYATDGYTLWGGWPNLPYWPSRQYLWEPAISPEYKLPVMVYPLITEDLVVNYGKDYRIWSTEVALIQQHKFESWENFIERYALPLMDLSLRGDPIGLASFVAENSWDWQLLKPAYDRQMKHIAAYCSDCRALSVTAEEMAEIYENRYPDISPDQIQYQSTGLGNPIPDSESVIVSTKKYRMRAKYDEDGGGINITDLRVYHRDTIDPYMEQTAKGKFASWIIPFFIDSSRFHLDMETSLPKLDLPENHPFKIRIKPMGNSEFLNEHFGQILSTKWQYKNDSYTTSFECHETSILLTGETHRNDSMCFELLCNPHIFNYIIQLDGNDYSLLELSDEWKAYSKKIAIYAPSGGNAGILIDMNDCEFIIEKEVSSQGTFVRIYARQEQNKIEIRLVPLIRYLDSVPLLTTV